MEKELDQITEQNIYESTNEDGTFDWEMYEYLCDIYDNIPDEEV